jgi:hypothetical protein
MAHTLIFSGELCPPPWSILVFDIVRVSFRISGFCYTAWIGSWLLTSGYKCAVHKVPVTNCQSGSCNIPTETRPQLHKFFKHDQLITTVTKFQVSNSWDILKPISNASSPVFGDQLLLQHYAWMWVCTMSGVQMFINEVACSSHMLQKVQLCSLDHSVL